MLRDLCGDAMCATFDVARASLVNRKSAACLSGDLGACGGGKFIDYASGFDSISATFDEKGALASVSVRGGTVAECTLGPKRSCAPQASDSFCPPRPISEHCGGKPCPTLKDTLERYAGEGGCPPNATIQRLPCGAFTVIDEHTGDASITRWFDPRGNMIAAMANNPEVRATMRWGETPKCSTGDGTQVCPAATKRPATTKKKRGK